jgi:hypothetical protein
MVLDATRRTSCSTTTTTVVSFWRGPTDLYHVLSRARSSEYGNMEIHIIGTADANLMDLS